MRTRSLAPLNLHWITEHLAVGGWFPPDAVERLAGEHAVRCVVDCRVEDRDDEALLARHGIALLHLPAIDGTGLALELLDAGVRWTGEQIRAGRRTLIHCQHGIGRSALLACCVLVAEGLAPLEALSVAKGARSVVSPSTHQLETFRQWLARWREAQGSGWEVPALEELTRIAWSHLAAGVESTGKPLSP